MKVFKKRKNKNSVISYTSETIVFLRQSNVKWLKYLYPIFFYDFNLPDVKFLTKQFPIYLSANMNIKFNSKP